MPLTINGATSGGITLTTPAEAGTNTLTLPARTGNIITSADSGTITTAMLAGANVTPEKLSQPLTLGTAQNTTSGTSIDFTGIPSWVKRISVIFDGVSLNGSSIPIVQLGTSSGFVTSGYAGGAGGSDTAGGNSVSANTNGLRLADSGNSSVAQRGVMQIVSLGSNIWVSTHATGDSAATRAYWGGGSIALSGTLDRVRITSVNGTDAFDAGSVNILYEG
jgi:hypothetical protein